MDSKETNVVLIGIGKTGIQYLLNADINIKAHANVVAIDTDQLFLDELPKTIKTIKVSKRLVPDIAVDRIASKLRTATKGCQMGFLVSDIDPEALPIEIISSIAYELSHNIESTVGLFTTPARKQGRSNCNKARRLIDYLINHIGVLEYPKDNLSGYGTPVTVISKAINQIVRMVNYRYMGISAVSKVLRFTGRIHLIDETLDSKEWLNSRWMSERRQRAYETERLIVNRTMETLLMSAEGLLVHITASPSLRKEDLQYFLLHLQGMIGIDAYIDIAIDIDETLESKLRIELLGTGVFTQEDWDEMFY